MYGRSRVSVRWFFIGVTPRSTLPCGGAGCRPRRLIAASPSRRKRSRLRKSYNRLHSPCVCVHTDMIQFHSLEIPQLERFLERHKSGLSLPGDVVLDLVLREILKKAYEFVPSE